MPFLVDDAKEAAIAKQILLLATFTFPDSYVLRLSTRDLTAAKGQAYRGHDYLGRVSQYTLDQIQGMTTQGIDVPVNVRIQIEDPSRQIYAVDLLHGFRGADIKLVTVFQDVLTGEFSTDEFLRFSGTCGQAQFDGQRLIIPAGSLVNFQQQKFPQALCQLRCPWIFPQTEAQRQDGFYNRRSIFRFCAYNPAAGRGTLGPDGQPYTTCDLSKENCQINGLYKIDASGRKTGGFGGVTFQLPPGTRTREYTSGNWLNLLNDNNLAKYGSPFPEGYGTFWVTPLAMNVFAEANSTRGECVVCVGLIDDILQVRVNDLLLPPANTVSGKAVPLAKGGEIMRYSILTIGNRVGGPNLDVPYNGQGDPYGSLAALMWVVPHAAASGQGNVQVKVRKGDTPLPTDTNPANSENWPVGYTENLPIIALDMYVRSGLKYSDFDLETVLTCAALADETAADGTGEPRFHGGLVYWQGRQPAATLLPRLLRSFNGQVIQNPLTGLYEMYTKGTIGQQQPKPVPGSNYNTGIKSTTLAGSAQTGYLAYYFNETNVIRQQNMSGFKQVPAENSAITNSVTIQFADRGSDYAQSSMKVVNSNDINRIGVENNITLEVDGIGSYGQGFRIGGTYLAEMLLGNIRNDSGGTIFLEWESSFRSCKLQRGQIIAVDPKELFSTAGLNPYPAITLAGGGTIPGILMRIFSIEFGSNGETAVIKAGWHQDEWYRDDWAKQFATSGVSQRRDTLIRPPLPWGAYLAATQPANPPIDHDFYDKTISYFGLTPDPTPDANGGFAINIDLSGHYPVNTFSPLAPPVLAPLGNVQAGGAVPGDGAVYFGFVCAKDKDGLLTVPSVPCRIDVTGTGSNWATTIPVDSWPVGTVGYSVFMGRNPTFSSWQEDGDGAPSNITLNHWNKETRNLPDPKFNDLLARAWEVSHSGPIGTTVSSVDVNTITLSGATTLTNDLTGYDCTLMAKFDGTELPVQNFRILSNAGNALTVNPDPVAAGIAPGDVIVVRGLFTVSGKTISDPALKNALENAGDGLLPSAEKGNVLVCIAGPGAGLQYNIEDNDATSITIKEDWAVIPTSDSRFIILYPAYTDERSTGRIANSDPGAFFSLTLPTGNFTDRTLFIKVYTRDADGVESVDVLTQGRELFIYGASADGGGSGAAAAPVTPVSVTQSIN